MTGFWLAILIIAVGIAAWNVGRWDLRRHLTPADHAAERDRLLDELDESAALNTRLMRRCQQLEQSLTRARRP